MPYHFTPFKGTLKAVMLGQLDANLEFLQENTLEHAILPSSCPSLVYLADMYGIYKSNEPLLIKKTSFDVKHCKIETVFISRSAQACKLKKTYF